MKKFCKFACVLMAAVICLMGCGIKNGEEAATMEPVQSQSPKTEESQTQAPQTSERKEVTEISEQFQTGINQFSYQIFDKLEDGKNIFISPYSMAIALSMLDNGANGKTKEEIEDVLGIKDLEDWNACVKYDMSLNKEEQAKLLTANSLWLSNQLTLSENARQDFFDPVNYYYGTEEKQLDLASEEALNEINQWVAEKTENMINPFLKEKLSSDIKMALINAVYFNGEWEDKFSKDDTAKLKFYGKNKTTDIDMMCKYDTSYKHAVKNGVRAIELPYAKSNIVMDVFLPENENEEISNIFSKLSEQEKSELFTTLSQAEKEEISTLQLPKFEFEYGVEEISNGLKSLGMEQAFDSGNADFSKISPGLYVDSVLHKAKIEVDEEGTKAAAVTDVQMKETAVMRDELNEFIVNKPFVFVIRDTEGGLILFMGSIQDLGE